MSRPPARWPEELDEGWSVEVGTGYSSPLVANGKIYQHARLGNDEVLWCLDLATGENPVAQELCRSIHYGRWRRATRQGAEILARAG